MKYKDSKAKRAISTHTKDVSEMKYKHMAKEGPSSKASMENFRRPAYGRSHERIRNSQEEE